MKVFTIRNSLISFGVFAVAVLLAASIFPEFKGDENVSVFLTVIFGIVSAISLFYGIVALFVSCISWLWKAFSEEEAKPSKKIRYEVNVELDDDKDTAQVNIDGIEIEIKVKNNKKDS